MATVLVVDDEPIVREVVVRYLAREGHDTLEAADGNAAREAIERSEPDLVVLDVMLPGTDGLELCRWIRARSELPVIMLTARGEEADRIVGLELGADDYVTKPFSLRELLARVRAVLRRPGPRQKFAEFAFDDVRVRSRSRQVFKAGREVRLTRKEFDLLVYLIAHRGEIVTRERLLDEVWGYERFPTTRTVDTHILRLRRKFEADPDRPVVILTVHGQGYRFVGQ